MGDITQPIIYTQQDFTRAHSGAFASGRVAVFTVRAPGKETVNEDAAALIPHGMNSGVLVVADGVGGIRGGDEAAKLAVNALVAAVRRSEEAEEIALREAILDGIEHANQAVIDLGTGAATTLAVIELQGDTVRPYHVGDSMILVSGQRGKVKFQSISHSPVGYAVESGLLDEADAIHHEERHIVSNVVGSPEMRIDIGPAITLAHRDTLVLASDGLSDNLYSEEIVERVRKGPLAAATDKLVEACQRQMLSPAEGHPSKPDDLTFILFRLD